MEGINSLARERQVLPLETVHLAQHTQGRSKTQIASTPPKEMAVTGGGVRLLKDRFRLQ